VNFKGTVISASSSTTKALFGFDPTADLVGRPLASFITQFEQFRVQQRQGAAASGGFAAAAAAAQSEGGDGSGQQSQRYSQIALQLQRDVSHVGPAAATAAAGDDLDQLLMYSGAGSTAATDDDSVLLTLLGQTTQEGGDATYRVGVRSVPVADDQIGRQRGAAAATTATSAAGGGNVAGVEGLWASVVGGKSVAKTHAGVMAVSVVEQDLSSSNGAAATDNVQFEVRRVLGSFPGADCQLARTPDAQKQ
jgi:hypothetical protein